MSRATPPASCSTLDEGLKVTDPGQLPDSIDEQIRVPRMDLALDWDVGKCHTLIDEFLLIRPSCFPIPHRSSGSKRSSRQAAMRARPPSWWIAWVRCPSVGCIRSMEVVVVPLYIILYIYIDRFRLLTCGNIILHNKRFYGLFTNVYVYTYNRI